MAFKFFVTLTIVAVASAVIIPTGPNSSTAAAKMLATYTTYSTTAAPIAAYETYSSPASYHQSSYAQPDQPSYSQSSYSQPAYMQASSAVVKAIPEYEKVGAFDSHPKYTFSYNVADSISGDTKSQVETRDGDRIQGEYSLIDADGFRRIVQYTVDAEHGFNAVVHREPISAKVTDVKETPLAYAAAPIVKPTYTTPDASYGH